MPSRKTDISPRSNSASAQPEAKKPDKEILAEEMREGLAALERPALGLFLSGLSGGLDIGFSILLMATAITIVPAPDTPGARLLTAACYAVGFIFVVLGRSELFTEQTTLAMLPVLDRRAPVSALGRLWLLVYVSNAVGVVAFAWLASFVGPRLGIAEPRAFALMGERVLKHPSLTILLSAVLAGWLMGLLSWLVAAARDTIGQIVIVSIVTTSIGFMMLHHSIVGMGEVAAAFFLAPSMSPAEIPRFMLWATLGNAIGGTVFVALLKYGRIMLGKAPGRWDKP